MKIIYNCYGGTHTSVMAAALHLGILKEDRFPSYRELMACPYFDKVNKKDVGKLFFMGKDEKGHEVYVLGCRNAGLIVEKVLNEFFRIVNISSDEFFFASTLSSLNLLIKLGGLLSRSLNLVTLGRIFLFPGCMISYPEIKKIVKKVKRVSLT